MARRRGAISGVTLATLAATILAGVGPAQAEEPAPAAEVVEPPTGTLIRAYIDGRNNEHWNAIRWMQVSGITTGYDDGRYYRPSWTVNRDAMAAFLYRMAGAPAYTAPEVSPFRDVSTTQQFYKEVAWLAEEGISKGWPDGTFQPHSPVNRDAMAAFLYRAADNPAYTAPAVSPFRDVRTGQQHYKEIAWLATKNISTGWSDGTFRALQPVARDAMAAFLYRYATPGWSPPTVTTFEKMPTVRNDGFAHRSATIGGISYADSAARRFDTQEQAILDLDNPGPTYQKIETVIGIEDGHTDPDAVYRVQVYFEDRIRGVLDVRPGQPVPYEWVTVDQQRIRFEVTKLAGSGSSTVVLGAPRALSKIDPVPPSPERTGPKVRHYFISHFDYQPNETFARRPEKIAAEYYPNSLSYTGIGATPQLLEHPLRGKYVHGMLIGASSRTADSTTQYRVRILDAAGTPVESFIATAGEPASLVTVEPTYRIEGARIAGTGEAPLVLGDVGFHVGPWPLQLAP